jgi:hypothetical protein
VEYFSPLQQLLEASLLETDWESTMLESSSQSGKQCGKLNYLS